MKKAFTLAEVLITLVVIGVIAALTIPSMISNIQDAHYKVAWKGAFSILSQASNRILYENGGDFKNLCPDTWGDGNCFRNAFASYINVIKLCEPGKTMGNCWNFESNIHYLNGTTSSGHYGSGNAGLILNNGITINIQDSSSDCSSGSLHMCGFFSVDTNGFKGPNTFGKDIFRLYIVERKILPYGPSNYNYCDPSGWGFGCAEVYLKQ